MKDPTTRSLDELLACEDWIRRLVRRLLSDEAAVDDVVQETWVHALTDEPPDTKRARGWLARVAKNRALMRLRGDRRRQRRERAVAKPERAPSAADVHERERLRRRVLDEVLRLEEPYRSVVLLRYFEELSAAEVAHRLGVPVETVRTRLKRAVAKLRSALDRQTGDYRALCLGILAIGDLPAATGSATVGATIVTGGLVVGTKVKVAIAVAVAITAAIVWWPKEEHSKADPERETEHTAARAPTPTAGPVRSGATTSDPAKPKTLANVDVTEPATAVAWVRGRVVDTGGAPIADARVRVLRYFERTRVELELIEETKSAADGTFALARVDEPVLVEASCKGYYAARVDARPDATLTITLGEPTGLGGRVFLAGEANGLEGALVALYAWRPEHAHREAGGAPGTPDFWKPLAETRTDAAGRYSFSRLRPGEYAVLVVPTAHPPSPWPGVRVRVNASPAEQDFVVDPGLKLFGRVTDAGTGQPIAGARVWTPPFGPSARTDAAGRYSVNVNRYGLSVEAAGYRTAGDFVAPITSGSFRRDFALTPGPIVRGRVVDPGGVGLAGVRVGRYVGAVLGTHPDPDVTVTDEDGRFQLVLTVFGNSLWAARAGFGFGCSEKRRFFDGPPDQRLDVVICLAPTGRIAGRVTTAGQGAAAGATVRLQAMNPFYSTRRTVRTDARGRYTLEDVPPGAWRVQAFPASLVDAGSARHAPQARIVQVQSGSSTEGDLTLDHGATIAGRVTDDHDQPIADASVSAIAYRQDGSRRRYITRPVHITRSDDRGAFRLDGLEAGDLVYELQVRHPDYGFRERETVQRRFIRSGTRGVVLPMARLYRVRGRVVELPDHVPAQTFSLSVKGDVGKVLFGVNSLRRRFGDVQGRFEVALPSGRHEVSALLNDGRASLGKPVVVDGAVDGIELRVPPAAFVSGVVRSPTGTVVAGCAVVATPDSEGAAIRSTCDADGRYRFTLPRPATYRISAVFAKEPSWHATLGIAARPGEHIPADLRFVEGGALRIRVEGPRGVALRKVKIVVRGHTGLVNPRDGRHRERERAFIRAGEGWSLDFYRQFTQTDDRGCVADWNAAPGDYSIEARLDGYDAATVNARVRAGVTTGVVVRLVPLTRPGR